MGSSPLGPEREVGVLLAPRGSLSTVDCETSFHWPMRKRLVQRRLGTSVRNGKLSLLVRAIKGTDARVYKPNKINQSKRHYVIV